ncbi:MAG: hypothetical protein WCT28_01070 [Patescibacteria group bacterium]|jgi:hypothetical protein
MAKLITLGSLIDKTVDHYHHNFKELVGITLWLIVGAAPFLFSGYIAPMGVDEATPMNELIAYLGINTVGFITTTIASFWIAACLILTIDARAKGNVPNHVALGKQSWRHIPELMALSIGIALAAGAATIALIVPSFLIMFLNGAEGALGVAIGVIGVLLLFTGIIAAIYAVIRYGVELTFAQFFLVLGQKNIWGAIKESHAAVQGSWWNIAIRLFVPNAIISLIVIAGTMTINIATTVLVSFAAASLSSLAIKLIAIGLTLSIFIVNALIMPLYSLAIYYLYDSIKRS